MLLQTFQFFCNWTIDNLCFAMEEMQDSIISRTFSTEDNDMWCLRLHRTGEMKRKEITEVLNCPNSPLGAQIKFCIINIQGEKTETATRSKAFNFLPGYEKCIKRSILRDFLLANAPGLVSERSLLLSAYGSCSKTCTASPSWILRSKAHDGRWARRALGEVLLQRLLPGHWWPGFLGS